MANRGKAIYGESGLLYIKSYLESISLEQEKYRDIFTLIDGSLSRLVLLSAHLCSNCSHKFGRIWKEVQDDLEYAHILFVKSQNSSQKPPTISEIRENDFQLKTNFMSNGEEYPNFYKSDVNQYKNTSRDTYNMFDAKNGEKDFKRTHSKNGSVRSGVYNDAQSQGSIFTCHRAATLTPVKQPHNNVTPIIDIGSPPSPFLGLPTLRGMSYPGSGHSSSLLSPYGSLGNYSEFKNYEASSSSEGDQSSENSLEEYLHGTEENRSPPSRRTPLDPSELPNDSSDRDDSFCDLLDTSPPPPQTSQTQSVGVGWEAAAVYGLAPSPPTNDDATDDIFIEKEIIHGKIARIANLLKLPVYDLEISIIEEVDLVNRQASRSPVSKTSPKPEQQDTCSSNIFETLEKFNERRRVQSLNQDRSPHSKRKKTTPTPITNHDAPELTTKRPIKIIGNRVGRLVGISVSANPLP